MSRLPVLDPAGFDPAQERFYKAIVEGRRGSIRGPFTPWLHSPDFADRAQNLGAYLRYESALPPRLSELAILVTAAFWRSRFEWFAHAGPARAAGLTEATIEAIRTGSEPEFAAEDERAVYRFARALHGRHEVDDETFAAARAAFGPKGVVDLIGLLGYYTLVAMTLNACRVGLPAEATDPFPETSASAG